MAQANGSLEKICDEIGDIERRMRTLDERRMELIKILIANMKKTGDTHYEGKRFTATAYHVNYAWTRWKDAYHALAKKVEVDAAISRGIVGYYTQNKPVDRARVYIPASRPKRRI